MSRTVRVNGTIKFIFFLVIGNCHCHKLIRLLSYLYLNFFFNIKAWKSIEKICPTHCWNKIWIFQISFEFSLLLTKRFNPNVDQFLIDLSSIVSNCVYSPYKDSYHGHLYTSDVRIIKDNKLRKLFTKVQSVVIQVK